MPAEDPGRPWSELRDTGLLWLINSAVLHPRGFALAIHINDAGESTGWSLIGDGSEPWYFTDDAESDDCFTRVTALLSAGREV